MRKLVIELRNVIILKWERIQMLNKEGSVSDIYEYSILEIAVSNLKINRITCQNCSLPHILLHYSLS